MSMPPDDPAATPPAPEPLAVPPSEPPAETTPPAPPVAASEAVPAAATASVPTRLPVYAVVLGLLAGAFAWILGEAAYGFYTPPPDLMASLAGTMVGMMDEAMTRNSVLSYGILGGVVGLVLGIGGGLARMSGRAAAIGGVTGLVVGGAAGALVSLGLVPIHNRKYDPDTQDLILPMLVHAAIFATAGLAGGLAFAVGLGARDRLPAAVLGGIVGAVLGAAAYEVLGAVLFPTANTVEPIAEASGARLLACLAVGLGTALGTLAGLSPPRPRPAKAPAPTA